MKLVGRVVVLLLVLGSLPGAAGATEEPAGFRMEETWFTRTSAPVTNLDARAGIYPSWSTTKPTASAPGGAGAVYVSNHQSHGVFAVNGEHDPVNGFTAKGTFAGEIDTMAVTLYAHVPYYLFRSSCGDGIALSFDLRIDGEEILYQQQSKPSARLRTTQVEPGFFSVKFAFTEISEMMARHKIPTGPDFTHEVYLNAINFYTCNELAWVYDSAEAPAGIVFNATDLRGYTEVDVFDPPPPF